MTRQHAVTGPTKKQNCPDAQRRRDHAEKGSLLTHPGGPCNRYPESYEIRHPASLAITAVDRSVSRQCAARTSLHFLAISSSN